MIALEPTLGRYRLLRVLGQGGVGQVHLACSHGAAGFEKLVALKVLRPELTSDPQQVQCLRDEAHIGVGLEQQNIVQILDLGEEAGRYYIVMEYIRGFSLAKTLSFLHATEVRLPVAMALHVFRALCRALEHVHAHDGATREDALFHGDVSAANVMLGASGRIALGDFGVAALLHQRPEQLAGKWSYVPPEALLGARVSMHWDLFALGALLYEMLSGAKAFPCDSFASRSKLGEHCTPLHQLRPELDRSLCDLVSLFLHPSLSDRLQSAKAMRASVDAVQQLGSDDIDAYERYINGLFKENDFVRSHGPLPNTTSSLMRAKDPFLEETEAPTSQVRLTKPLRFGLSMAHGSQLAKQYGEELAAALSGPLERPVRPVLLGDYQTLLDCLLRGDVDIAWMPPALMAQAVGCAAGLLAVSTRQGRMSYNGCVFVAKDSPLQSIEDLAGKTMAWVDQDSASGHLLVKAMLEEQAGPIDEFLGRTSFHGSHRGVCEAVANGWTDAGSTYVVLNDDGEIVTSAWGELFAERGDELRMLVATEPVPGDCIAYRPHLSEQWRQELQEVFYNMHTSEAGMQLLDAVFRVERFVPGKLEDYEAIRFG